MIAKDTIIKMLISSFSKAIPDRTPNIGIKKVTETALVASYFEISLKKMTNAAPEHKKPNIEAAFQASVEISFSGQYNNPSGSPLRHAYTVLPQAKCNEGMLLI